MKKILSILSFTLLIIILLTSCTANYGGTKEDKTVVGKCGEEDIYLEEYRYLYYANKKDIQSEYGEGCFDGDDKATYEEMLQERIKSDIISFSTIVAVAKLCDLSMDKGDAKDAVEEQVKEVIKTYKNTKSYVASLENDHMTHDFFKYLIGIEVLTQNLMYYMVLADLISTPTDEEELTLLIGSNMYKTEHVYLPYNYGGKTKEENREKIEKIYANLQSGKYTFSKAIYEGCTDTGLAEGGNYYLMGYADVEYENAVISLSVGQYSEIIECNDAFYIVKRLPVDTSKYLNNLYELREEYLKILYNEYLTNFSKTLTVEFYDVSMVK